MITPHLIDDLLELSPESRTMLDSNLASMQIDKAGITELSFFMDFSQPSLKLLWNLLLNTFPNAQIPGLTPSNISVHPKDGVSYLGDSIVVDYSDSDIPGSIIREFDVPDSVRPNSAFKLKYNLDTKEVMLKLYDTAVSKYPRPNTPEGTIWGSFIGVGRQFSKSKQTNNILDFYYLSRDREAMREWLGDDYPNYDETFVTEARGYAVSTDWETGRIVNVKRHIYARDPALLNVAGV